MSSNIENGVSVNFGFSTQGGFWEDEPRLRLLRQATIIPGYGRFMPDTEASTELGPADPGEALTSVEVNRLPFRERCERFLERSHESTSPIALELTNFPLWLREVNDANKAQAEAEGRPFEPKTLGTFSIDELEERFHNDDAIYAINLYAQDPEALKIARRYSPQWSHMVNNFDEEKDVRASGFAVMAYEPNPSIAKDWSEVDDFIEKMHELGKKVIVDYVDNHVGLSNAWALTNPEYFIQPTEDEFEELETIYQQKQAAGEDEDIVKNWLDFSFRRIVTDEVNENGENVVRYYARGKDPYFDPWLDTLQLNYTNPGLQRAMCDQLLDLVRHGVDGVRCDMAHLPTAMRFRETWGDRLSPEQLDYLGEHAFWPPAIIEAKDEAKQLAYERARVEGKTEEEAAQIREETNFLFIAEVYEERDKKELGELSRETSQWASDKVRGSGVIEAKEGEGGFDLIYAKDLLDHLHRLYEGKDPDVNYHTVRKHLQDTMSATDFRRILFLENHDEERAAAKFGEASKAFVTLLACLREVNPPQQGEQGTVFLVHQGQDEGRTIRPRMQMARLPSENPSNSYLKFYNDGKPEILLPGLLQLKGSRLFQEGTCNMLNLDLSNSNPSLFSFHYELDDPAQGKLGAVVTINLGNHQAAGRIPGIEKGMDLSVVSMTMRREIERPDSQRNNGLYVELSPYEVQIAYYDPDSQAQERLAA